MQAAYDRPEGESIGDIAAGIDAMYRILFRIDPGGRISKAFKRINLSNRSAWSLRKLFKKTLQVTGCVR